VGAVLFSLLLASCIVDYTPTEPTPTPVATSITLSATSLSFALLGDTTQLAATVKDAAGTVMAGATVTWATSAAAVATVSATGLVTAVANGSATITATSGSASATASVSVAAPFFLAANGVTVLCRAADVGETGTVGGVIYTKRSKAQIDALVDGEDYASLATTCTSIVTDMSFMFDDAVAFNQDLSGWCVSNIASKPSGFDSQATSWVLARPVWGTCP